MPATADDTRQPAHSVESSHPSLPSHSLSRSHSHSQSHSQSRSQNQSGGQSQSCVDEQHPQAIEIHSRDENATVMVSNVYGRLFQPPAAPADIPSSNTQPFDHVEMAAAADGQDHEQERQQGQDQDQKREKGQKEEEQAHMHCISTGATTSGLQSDGDAGGASIGMTDAPPTGPAAIELAVPRLKTPVLLPTQPQTVQNTVEIATKTPTSKNAAGPTGTEFLQAKGSRGGGSSRARAGRQGARSGRPPNINENPLLRRLECVMAVETGRLQMADACLQYEISARTFYRWVNSKSELIRLTGLSPEEFRNGVPTRRPVHVLMQRMPHKWRDRPSTPVGASASTVEKEGVGNMEKLQNDGQVLDANGGARMGDGGRSADAPMQLTRAVLPVVKKRRTGKRSARASREPIATPMTVGPLACSKEGEASAGHTGRKEEGATATIGANENRGDWRANGRGDVSNVVVGDTPSTNAGSPSGSPATVGKRRRTVELVNEQRDIDETEERDDTFPVAHRREERAAAATAAVNVGSCNSVGVVQGLNGSCGGLLKREEGNATTCTVNSGVRMHAYDHGNIGVATSCNPTATGRRQTRERGQLCIPESFVNKEYDTENPVATGLTLSTGKDGRTSSRNHDNKMPKSDSMPHSCYCRRTAVAAMTATASDVGTGTGADGKHRIVVSMGERKASFIWYPGTVTEDIKAVISRRFSLLPTVHWALFDHTEDEVVISPGVPSGCYNLIVL